jgi:hypothetical protein
MHLIYLNKCLFKMSRFLQLVPLEKHIFYVLLEKINFYQMFYFSKVKHSNVSVKGDWEKTGDWFDSRSVYKN